MNKNLIEERAVNDPEIAEYMRAEIARIEQSANEQLDEARDKLMYEARQQITNSAKRAAKSVDDSMLAEAYSRGKRRGFNVATVLFATIALATYLVLNI